MRYSIKAKITLWYTCIFSLLLSGTLLCVYMVSRSYSTHDIEIELRDEIADMVEQIDSCTHLVENVFAGKDWTAFYDDNVMLSLYTEDGIFINGLIPDNFPTDYPFADEMLRRWEYAEESWLILDYHKECISGETLWIRSIASYSSWNRILRQMLTLFSVIFPLSVVFAAGIGYFMLRRALHPIYTISDTATEIAGSVDLSKRVDAGIIKDEFSYLTEAFNRMLNELELSFEAEKQFASDASHELRTPIAVIQAHCEYCLDELKPEGEMRQEVEIIYDKTKRIGQLVTQLLSISRAERGKIQLEKEMVDLVILTESVMEELEEKAAQKGIIMSIADETEGNAFICGDMMMLMRLMLNLIDNAILYGKKNGTVQVGLSRCKEQLCIKVTDDGIGISAEHLDKIWNRFYRVDKSRSGGEGFGLGLHMVKWIAELHGGTITVDSVPGVGTTFTVML